MISQVKIVSITVKDQDRALAFYTEKLGFKVVTDAPMGASGRWIEVATPAGDTRVALLLPHSEDDKVGGFSNVIFSSADVRKTYAELQERGVEFVEPPTEQSWGTYAVFVDVDGNRFVIGTEN
ncbi:MAG: VOC family protein [Acidobacteriota bacterium]